MEVRTPALRPRQIRGDLRAVMPRPSEHRKLGPVGRASPRPYRAMAFLAATTALLALGAPSPRAAPPGLHSLASSADRSNVLTIERPSRVAPADVLVAAVAVRSATGAISHPPGWTLIRRDMSGNVGAELSVAVYVHVAGQVEPGSYRWMFDAPVAAVGSIQAYGGVSRMQPFSPRRPYGRQRRASACSPSLPRPGKAESGRREECASTST